MDYETEKELFLILGTHTIAADCHYYDESCRIEAFYQGRTLQAEELFEPIQKIRFIPYAHQRFTKFLRTYAQKFGDE